MARNLVWIGVLMYAVSWFLPVLKSQDPGWSRIESLPDGPPGWQAVRYAWQLLDLELRAPSRDRAEGVESMVLGSTSLTNIVMAVALLALFSSRRAIPGILGWILLPCVVLNLSWIYLNPEGALKSLSFGYYVWVASFIVTGLGAIAGGADRAVTCSRCGSRACAPPPPPP
jgi:hypothetical protein